MESGNPVTQRAGDFELAFEPVGASPTEMAAIRERVLASEVLAREIGTARYRLLRLDAVDEDGEEKQQEGTRYPGQFRATIYEYDNNRTLFVEGHFDEPSRLKIVESAVQPLPSDEEMRVALDLLQRSPQAGALIAEQRVVPYPAMPAVVGEEYPDGRRRRVLAIGLLPRDPSARHEIIGVALDRDEVISFPEGFPLGSLASAESICGIAYVPQPTTRNAAGQVNVTISQGGQVLWTFRALRPAGSTGTNGSGIELRSVEYRGKRLLYRANLPFLNVKYDNDACGPYRDWQNQEGMIRADGTDVAPGFRFCPTPATTVLETGDDGGNFLGTAIFVQGQEVVFVCEMEAGWYRYISQWRFDVDGTLRPRFGFGAVQSSCVCNRHHHHCYWRLDFDIVSASDNLVQEFNDPPLIGGSNWHDKSYEIRRSRDAARSRFWRVLHVPTGSAYDIMPGHDDGSASGMPDAPFGRGDLWLTCYRATEIDDGVIAVGPPYEADIDRWINGELLRNQDVVVWYAAHFTHDLSQEPPGVFGHVIGPDLRPVNW